VRGKHRADSALAVGVGADDDAVVLDALEHRPARLQRQAVDRCAQVSGGLAASHVMSYRSKLKHRI
jgi:hypothetical protein